MGNEYLGGTHTNSNYIAGDVYPSNFSFSSEKTNSDLLKLYRRNEFVQIMCDWMPFEAFRKGIEFVKDEGTKQGIKFDKPYSFEGYTHVDPETLKTTSLSGFQEFLQWIDFETTFLMGVAFSRLYPEGGLLVFLDDQTLPASKKTTDIPWSANGNAQGYMQLRAFQPMNVAQGSGFEPHDSSGGKVTEWKVTIQQNTKGEKKSYIIAADRCIHMIWKKKENGWKGSSRVLGFANLCVAEDQTFKRLLKRANDVAGGILHVECESLAEQEVIDAAIGNNLTAVDIVYTLPGRVVDFKTPDLKASGEFMSIYDIYTRKLVRHMRINQEILDGNKQGAGLSGNTDNDVMVGYSEMYQIQNHYRVYLERCFYKLGREDTRFIYNEILPDNMAIMSKLSGDMNGDGTDNPAGGDDKPPKPDGAGNNGGSDSAPTQ